MQCFEMQIFLFLSSIFISFFRQEYIQFEKEEFRKFVDMFARTLDIVLLFLAKEDLVNIGQFLNSTTFSIQVSELLLCGLTYFKIDLVFWNIEFWFLLNRMLSSKKQIHQAQERNFLTPKRILKVSYFLYNFILSKFCLCCRTTLWFDFLYLCMVSRQTYAFRYIGRLVTSQQNVISLSSLFASFLVAIWFCIYMYAQLKSWNFRILFIKN